MPQVQKNKISKSLIGRNWSCKDENSRREKISNAMKKNPNGGGYRIGSGRCRGLWYDSLIAGRVYLDSSYEHRIALYLDKKNISWCKNKKKFSYIDENGKKRNYTPDFYLHDLDLWIETKGFKTKRDECKWKCFPFKIKILFKEDIEKLELEVTRLDEDTALKAAGV